VTEALEDVGIAPLADRPIHMLSLGQKRRVAIAGVLAMRPAVLVLDEPTAGLDPRGVVHLLEVLRRLVDGGTTVVYATHDVDLALAWSDRVALFADGRVIACDTPERAMADPALLRQAHLRRPLLLELAEHACALGLIRSDAPPPRTVAEMAALLSEASERGAATTVVEGR
jgi:cobalt/nickel transport system ATP-binding protein